jgi:hypothetical protein
MELNKETFRAFLRAEAKGSKGNERFARANDVTRCPIATWLTAMGHKVSYVMPDGFVIRGATSATELPAWASDYIDLLDGTYETPTWITADEALKVLVDLGFWRGDDNA